MPIHLVDFHSHILPGVDHGAKSLEESISQIALMRQHGIENVVATSHFCAHEDILSDFVALRKKGFDTLSAEMERCDLHSPKIYLGAEVLVFAGLENLQGIEQLAIEGTNTLLLELPYGRLSPSVQESVVRLIHRGFHVVLAHADRYNAEDIDALVSFGAEIQLNACALATPMIKRHLRRWLKEGTVVAIGSDIHGIDKHAYPIFLRAEKRIGRYFDSIKLSSEKILGI